MLLHKADDFLPLPKNQIFPSCFQIAHVGRCMDTVLFVVHETDCVPSVAQTPNILTSKTKSVKLRFLFLDEGTVESETHSLDVVCTLVSQSKQPGKQVNTGLLTEIVDSNHQRMNRKEIKTTQEVFPFLQPASRKKWKKLFRFFLHGNVEMLEEKPVSPRRRN